MANNNDNCSLKDFVAPNANGLQSSIIRLIVEANNFELKYALLSMIFLEYCDTVKLNGVTFDAIRLRFFPFSLRDRARSWLLSLPIDSITTWDELLKAFLSKYFPPSKIAQLRNQITTFAQKEDESLFYAWDMYKELLHLCPHHGLERWLVLHTFYNGLNYNTKLTVDVATGHALMNKRLDKAYELIEDVALNHCQWSNERGPSKENFYSRQDPSMEQANFVNNFGQKGHSDAFSNTYNPNRRNHPNFSYRNSQNAAHKARE
ncbi:hypothetical protein L6164_033385 [Bauhinia variegata]|uniref:Uncharacterized protein n=1 Tax=Bauhinia variegata TaxID=167791 RepID=A0ACB9KRJ2_BAUVA|nr:hypothetical protein L6164_033385 [Bauhinia variegata]